VAAPLAVFGPARAWRDWQDWRAVANRELTDPVAEFRNQSLLAALKRGLTQSGQQLDPVHYAVADLSPGVVRGIYYGVTGLALVGLALLFRRHPAGLTGPAAAGELAICIGAMTVVDPLAWKAHYVTLIVPYTFIWWALRHGSPGRRWRLGLLWASVLLLTLSAPAFVGNHARDVLESLDVILIGAVLVVVLAASLVEREARPQGY
jgi:hypothetical protein